jgi:SagB-type dehydrogenase family enzyme
MRTEIKLPRPRHKSDVSIEETLLKRRSIRDYATASLTLQEVSQLLWAAQGMSAPPDFRTSPSAGATYPLETYLMVGEVEGLTSGVYRYNPAGHSLLKVIERDLRASLAASALGQRWIKDGAISIVFTAIYERTTRRYRERGIRYVHMEVGHAAQNVCLQAVALELGTVVVGAFDDQRVKKVMNLPKEEEPLYILPLGRKK